MGLRDIARSALLSSGSRSPELSENTADAADEAAVTERATFADCPKNYYPEILPSIAQKIDTGGKKTGIGTHIIINIFYMQYACCAAEKKRKNNNNSVK